MLLPLLAGCAHRDRIADVLAGGSMETQAVSLAGTVTVTWAMPGLPGKRFFILDDGSGQAPVCAPAQAPSPGSRVRVEGRWVSTLRVPAPGVGDVSIGAPGVQATQVRP